METTTTDMATWRTDKAQWHRERALTWAHRATRHMAKYDDGGGEYLLGLYVACVDNANYHTKSAQDLDNGTGY